MIRQENIRRSFLPALLVFGFVVRIGYGLRFPPLDPQGHIMDSDRYVALAASIADHWGFLDENGRPTAHREPSYPAVLGLVYKIFGRGYLPLLALNAVMDIAMLWLLFLVGNMLFGETVAIMAAAIGVVYPPFIYYAAQPLRDTMMTFLGCLLLRLLIQSQQRQQTWGFALAGIVSACAALTKTALLPFGVLLPFAVWFFNRRDRAAARRRVAAYLACFVCLYSTWVVRNYRQFHSVILGTNVAAGDHFYMFQIVPQTVGGMPEHYAILDKDPVWQEGQKLGEVEKDKFFWKAGARRIQENPLSYARLFCWRFFWDMWRLSPRPRVYAHSYAALKWISLSTDGWIVPLGLIGTGLVGLSPPAAAWIYLFIFSVDFAYSLILTMLRYRLPLMPWLILFACVTLSRAWKKLGLPARSRPEAERPRRHLEMRWWRGARSRPEAERPRRRLEMRWWRGAR